VSVPIIWNLYLAERTYGAATPSSLSTSRIPIARKGIRCLVTISSWMAERGGAVSVGICTPDKGAAAMPKYLYIGDDVRVVPDLSVEVKPGDIVELDNENPGPLFKKVADNRKVTATPGTPAETEPETEE
jgi:hypothetical protein